jgi:hypothetical protein
MAKILGVIPREIPTEQAAVAFGLLAGVGGGAAQWIAGRRLSGYQGDSLPIGNLVIPVLVGGVSTAAAAFLLPTQ